MDKEKLPINAQEGADAIQAETPDQKILEKVFNEWRGQEAGLMESSYVMDLLSRLWREKGNELDAKKVCEALEKLSQKALEMKADIKRELEK